MTVFIDTSVLVAAILQSHPNHQRAFHWVDQIANGDHRGVISEHSLAETYSVLTRINIPFRLSPGIAWEAIERNSAAFEILTLTEAEVKSELERLATMEIGGGAVYDRLIAAVARKVDFDLLLTFNVKHFLDVAPDLADLIKEP